MPTFFRQIVVLFIFFVGASQAYGESWDDVPVMYQGRIRPAEAYARLWLYNLYHHQAIRKEDASLFFTQEKSPADILLKMQFSQMDGSRLQANESYVQSYEKLSQKKIAPQQMAFLLESQFPLGDRLKLAGETLQALPSRTNPSVWYSLKALKILAYNPQKKVIEPVSNFTLYSDENYNTILGIYLNLEKALENHDEAAYQNDSKALAEALKQAYAEIAGIPYNEAFEKALTTPSFLQLKAEVWYYRLPLILVCIILYSTALLLFAAASSLRKPPLDRCGLFLMLAGFAVHTFILVLRCYILRRPPVSNMFETVVYVPWIAVGASLIIGRFLKSSIPPAASAIVSLALLIVLQLTRLNNSMENVQAVLDSQYWLIVHVLMVVGSYGVFLLSGVLGHFYLAGYAKHGKETPMMLSTSKLILQTMYAGVALLIPGTILGGIWAAESWGRFWDWDPKEAWAFISICIYLLWIHAYTFHKIGRLGLAIGSVVGLMAVAFTWYGVNYVLGTGLHSYGFGSGGEVYFYVYLIFEIVFLSVTARKPRIAL